MDITAESVGTIVSRASVRAIPTGKKTMQYVRNERQEPLTHISKLGICSVRKKHPLLKLGRIDMRLHLLLTVEHCLTVSSTPS